MTGSGVHVIVIGNEKGGSGKSTTAFHVAVYLLYQGFRVATIDVDSRQQTLTQFVRNRRDWARGQGLRLPHTTHFHLPRSGQDSIKANQQAEFAMLEHAVADVEASADFLVIDTPGFDTNLTRLAHSLADTLITPINDSQIDLSVFARFDEATGEPTELGHYARLVQRARAERMQFDGRPIDWILLRNRTSMLASRNMRQVQVMLDKLALRLGLRLAEGIAERVIFRSLFAAGLTVFDPIDTALMGGAPSMSYESAKHEYRSLITAMNLPRRKEEGRGTWASPARLADEV
jgi:chromosome partitioning protein